MFRGIPSMILTAHQPVYLPWLGLFHKIALADTFVSFNQVQYLAKDWNNRNLIKAPQGPLWLTVPVLRKGYLEKTISEIEINNNEPWQRKHWRSLEGNYRRAPYFAKYADFFEDVYRREWRLLTDLNDTMLKWFLDTLGIRVRFLDASEYRFEGAKSALVLDMCRQLGASTYIFGALGKDYADVTAFERAGVGVVFQDYRHPEYPQQGGPFLPNLSVVDLLFNCGERSGEILMSGNLSKVALVRRDGRAARHAPSVGATSAGALGQTDGRPASSSGGPVEPPSGAPGPLSVLIRADASAAVGTGHVMRMLALGQALKDEGAGVTLGTVGTPDALVTRWEAEGIRVIQLRATHPDPRDAEATLALAGDCRADWVVVDGYDFDAAYHRRIRSAGHALLVVDDYAHRPEYDADVVVNQNISANDFAYRLPPYVRRLFGLPYVMLRREFRSARETLEPLREEARRVLVTLGGGDEHDVTGLVLDALALVTGRRLVVDVVVGVAYDHRGVLERRLAGSPHEVHLHINTAEMPRLMQQADMAVSGAGSTCWELAALGVPMCLVTLAENQRAIAEHLGALGAAVALGWYHELSAARVAETVSGLLHNPGLRQRLRSVCLPLIDGRGCERIISQLQLQRCAAGAPVSGR